MGRWDSMARPLRIQYEGAIYHVMSRGNRRERIYGNDGDRLAFLELLGRACAKTGWQVHAYCLMSNHFHAVIETPQANLVAGMKWLLGVYTQRYNHRHAASGHLFGGRYKAMLIDERDPAYLRMACDYVHLNPARAGLLGEGRRLEDYAWSSYPEYLKPARKRPPWVRVDRVLAEHGLGANDAAARREFRRRMESSRRGAMNLEALEKLRTGWRLGAPDFLERLVERHEPITGEGHRGEERRETDEVRAERIVREELKRLGLKESDLPKRAKGASEKVAIARKLRRETTTTQKWIANRLQMGGWKNVANLLGQRGTASKRQDFSDPMIFTRL